MQTPSRPSEFILEKIRRHLDYNPNTGTITWKNPVGPMLRRCHHGDRAGHLNGSSVMMIQILNPDTGQQVSMPAQHVAIFIASGEWPTPPVYNRNGKRDDNRIENLCYSDYDLDRLNRRLSRCSATGIRGVYEKKPEGASPMRFIASIRADGKCVHLGTFDTIDKAHAARITAEKILFGGVCMTNRKTPTAG